MTRSELGTLMLTWHGGQNDPLYAVGSYYIGGNVHPQRWVVKDALANAKADLRQNKAMLAGEAVIVRRNGVDVDLRVFAGYTDRKLRRNVRDFRRIVRGLRAFLRTDYPAKSTDN